MTKRELDGKSICNDCCRGKKLLDLEAKRKDRSISRIQFLKIAKKEGMICVRCIHNDLSGKIAKTYKLLYPDFQTLDLYNPFEDEKDADSFER